MSTYPYINDKDIKSLRKMKKEDLVALVCFFATRLNAHDKILQHIIMSVMDKSLTSSEFKSYCKQNIEDFCNKTFALYNEYKPFVKKMNVEGSCFSDVNIDRKMDTSNVNVN